MPFWLLDKWFSSCYEAQLHLSFLLICSQILRNVRTSVFIMQWLYGENVSFLKGYMQNLLGGP